MRDGGERADAQRFVKMAVDRIEHAVEAFGFGRVRVAGRAAVVPLVGLRGRERFAAGFGEIASVSSAAARRTRGDGSSSRGSLARIARAVSVSKRRPGAARRSSERSGTYSAQQSARRRTQSPSNQTTSATSGASGSMRAFDDQVCGRFGGTRTRSSSA